MAAAAATVPCTCKGCQPAGRRLWHVRARRENLKRLGEEGEFQQRRMAPCELRERSRALESRVNRAERVESRE